MEIKIKIDELKQAKLFVATPMYGGQCFGQYTRAIADLSSLCTKHEIHLSYYFLFNESLVTRARNYCADEFMRSDCTHMLFIDSDIGFDANDIFAMLGLSLQNDDYDILCAPYPKKTISWEKIKRAVDIGVADEDPNQLERYVGDYAFNPVGGTNQIKISEPAEVAEGGTGFMLIKRKVFERMNEEYPNLLYKPDHVRTAAFDGSREIMAYFDAIIDDKYMNLMPDLRAYLEQTPTATHEDILDYLSEKREGVLGKYSNRYLSEDYMFCYWARKIGMKLWLCPWIKLKHAGHYNFGGSLADLAAIGATATADPKLIKGRKPNQ
jgi:hypothetical protein